MAEKFILYRSFYQILLFIQNRYWDQIDMILLQVKHLTLTFLLSRRSNFLDPQPGQIGHALNPFN